MPGVYDLRINKGETLELPITYKDETGQPINLTNYTARLQVRERHESTSVLLELTTENGGITIDGPAGTLTLHLAAAASAALTWERGVYDLEIVSPSGVVTRLLEGAALTRPEVTR